MTSVISCITRSVFHNNIMKPQKGFQMFHIERKSFNQNPGVGVVLQQASEKCIKKLIIKKKHTASININLRKVILINS